MIRNKQGTVAFSCMCANGGKLSWFLCVLTAFNVVGVLDVHFYAKIACFYLILCFC